MSQSMAILLLLVLFQTPSMMGLSKCINTIGGAHRQSLENVTVLTPDSCQLNVLSFQFSKSSFPVLKQIVLKRFPVLAIQGFPIVFIPNFFIILPMSSQVLASCDTLNST